MMKQFSDLKVKSQGHCWESFFVHIFAKSRSIYIKSTPKWSPANCTHVMSSNTLHQWKRTGLILLITPTARQ